MEYKDLASMMPQFDQRIHEQALKTYDTNLHVAAYKATLHYILDNHFIGGCHLFSAVLYVLFVEAENYILSLSGEFENREECGMYIGIVRTTDSTRFDHSWVNAGGLIYDTAVCLPLSGGARTDGPVFASLDLLTGKTVSNLYIQSDTDSLDKIGEMVASWSLSQYGEEILKRDNIHLWKIITTIGCSIGFSFDPDILESRYGPTLRICA